MITLPVLLSVGISFPLATAIQKVSATFWVVASAYNYLKDRQVHWFLLITFALIGLIGAYLGVLTVVNVKNSEVCGRGIYPWACPLHLL
jgi:uncharacterized membrane protein YfcA